VRALITGVTGMDGSHLAELLGEDHDVFGLVRDPDAPRRDWAATFTPVVGDLLDDLSLRRALCIANPDVIYHLGAMSSPVMAWTAPGLCADVTGVGTLRLLAAMAAEAPHARVVVAGTIAEHGPYGAAKLYARTVAADYRKRGFGVTTVLMGGHHSPRRGASYLSQKVATHAGRTAVGLRHAEAAGLRGQAHKLQLGWLGRSQDWGWAPDFMHVWSQIHHVDPGEYVLSTGVPLGVAAYVGECYAFAGLSGDEWMTHEPQPGGEHGGQPTDVAVLSAWTSPELLHLTTGLPSFEDPTGMFHHLLVPAMVGAAMDRAVLGNG